jgi:filamentous hemagglutinin family protein
LPSGGHFVAGNGSINGNATSLTINQTSNRGVIDWTGFSIGNGNRVTIRNGMGATLNRVTGADPSLILGTLSATGSVYLINPQGVVIGNNGVVAAGGRFVASTLGTDNASFMNGGPLTLSGTTNASVINLGKIASSHGDVFLIATNDVVNLGTVSAPKGTAEFAAGKAVLLRDSSTSRQVFVQRSSGGTVVNAGTVKAAQINLQAADGNIFALAGNHAVLRANGTAKRDGHVWLVAGRGNVTIDGTIEARNANGGGGTVDTSAANLLIADGANSTALVRANRWNITVPSFTIDAPTAPVFKRSLDKGTSIDVRTTGAAGASGDIDVAASIHWIGAASLTLAAYRSLTIDAAAKLKNCGSGNLTLRADSSAIDNGGGIANNGTVDWSTSRGIVGAFYDMNGSYKPGTLLTNRSWTSPRYSGLVTQITGYKLVNSLADLTNVAADLAGNYALGRDIDASATSSGSYTPIGNDSTPFTGQFDGQGHAIHSLSLYAETQYEDPAYLGLFGTLGARAIVRNLTVNGTSSIAGAPYVDEPAGGYFDAQGDEGILAAHNYGTILRVNTSGSMGGFWSSGNDTTAGGLVGVNHGTIERSSSSVTNDTLGTSGGLVGENDGAIEQSYSSGSVSGYQIGTSHSGGSTAVPGGLVGVNNGSISQSYETGAVTNSCYYSPCGAGGLVDINNGTISQSFTSGAVTIEAQGDLDERGRIGAIAEANHGTIANDAYWNKDTTGLTVGVGTGTPLPASHGLTTAQMSNPASFSGWNFSTTGAWALPAGYQHPILRWQVAPPSSN